MSDAPPRILVVSADEALHRFLAAALSSQGYDVRTGSSGRDALEQVHRWDPDLVLLDLVLPDGAGHILHAAQRLIEHVADRPVIVLTATDLPRAWATARCATAALQMPFNLEALFSAGENGGSLARRRGLAVTR